MANRSYSRRKDQGNRGIERQVVSFTQSCSSRSAQERRELATYCQERCRSCSSWSRPSRVTLSCSGALNSAYCEVFAHTPLPLLRFRSRIKLPRLQTNNLRRNSSTVLTDSTLSRLHIIRHPPRCSRTILSTITRTRKSQTLLDSSRTLNSLLLNSLLLNSLLLNSLPLRPPRSSHHSPLTPSRCLNLNQSRA